MKAKKILLLLLAVIFVFAAASCGGGTKSCNLCVDEDGDGTCDVCNKEMPKEEIKDIPLVEDGEPTFQVILGKDTSTAVRQAVTSDMKSEVRQAYGTAIDAFIEGSELDEEIDIEILVGNVTSRGDKYSFDGHTLGKEGFAIQIVGSKIIINGGSDETLIKAIENFTEFLVNRDSFDEVVMTKADTVLEVQDGYKVTSLKVNGTDMRGYTFAVDLTRSYYKEVAESIQDTFYDKTGYWFNIVDIENATDKSVVLKHVDGAWGEDSFKVSVKGSQLVIECGFDNMLGKSQFF